MTHHQALWRHWTVTLYSHVRGQLSPTIIIRTTDSSRTQKIFLWDQTISHSYSIRDYKSTHFKYKDLEKIHGHLDVGSLLHSLYQLKICTMSTDYLMRWTVTILSSHSIYHFVWCFYEFSTLPQTYSSRVIYSIGSTLEYGRSLSRKICSWRPVRTYNECQAVEQVLQNQLVDAIPPAYLNSLRNVNSDMINDSIPTIITFFTTNYCQLIDQELSDRKDELKKTPFNPDEPVDLIFNRIK